MHLISSADRISLSSAQMEGMAVDIISGQYLTEGIAEHEDQTTVVCLQYLTPAHCL